MRRERKSRCREEARLTERAGKRGEEGAKDDERHTEWRGCESNQDLVETLCPKQPWPCFFFIMGEPLVPSTFRFPHWDLMARHTQLHFPRSREKLSERGRKKPYGPTNFPIGRVSLDRMQVVFPGTLGWGWGWRLCQTSELSTQLTAKFWSSAKLILFCSWINKVREKKAGITHF